jgi:hypothetical protein
LIAIAETSMNRLKSFNVLPQVNFKVKTKYHGIPKDQDIEKRNEAKKLLAHNKALLYVRLLLPNCDRYFGEPYFPYQTNRSTINFAYRDHFSAVIKTKQPYLSNVINAVTTGKPLAILAIPIYSDTKNHNLLIWIQVLGLNFSYFDELVKPTLSAEHDSNKRAALLDNNGIKIAGSSYNNKINNIESFNKLKRFQNAKRGQSGTTIEAVDDKNMSISYTPIKFAQTKWVLYYFHQVNDIHYYIYNCKLLQHTEY